jgi:hypothetical protein
LSEGVVAWTLHTRLSAAIPPLRWTVIFMAWFLCFRYCLAAG